MSAPSSEQLAELDMARCTLDAAAERLREAVKAICPEHAPTQHRDGKPPWCKTCGRDALGYAVRFQP